LRLSTFAAIAQALAEEGVRYLVAGGMAVIARGYPRFTVDVDLVIALDRDNVLAAFRALGQLGYRPTVPVSAEDFADTGRRQGFIRDKGMLVLNFHSPSHKATPVDVFVVEPFDFAVEYERTRPEEIAPGVVSRFVTIATLVAMKSGAEWEARRRAKIRQWLRLTVRERFEAVEAAGEFARFMASKREGEGSAEPGTRR
jgi:hypothetical protein